jgi:hypothetical protein
MTGLCTEVQVGKDQRVVAVQIHIPVVAAQCYGLMNVASILVHGNYKSNRFRKAKFHARCHPRSERGLLLTVWSGHSCPLPLTLL